MRKQVTQKTATPARRLSRANTVAFPRELRDAIPELPTYVGRVLELDSIDGKAFHTPLTGPRVLLKLSVKETGKLRGQFVVRVDLHPDAARALAATLEKLAGEVEPAAKK